MRLFSSPVPLCLQAHPEVQLLGTQEAAAEVWPLVAPQLLAEAAGGPRHLAKHRGGGGVGAGRPGWWCVQTGGQASG